MKYDKLVRDKIPQQIADSGAKAIFRVASESEFPEYLKKKLHEEVAEYCESNDPYELADIYEVILSLAELHGLSQAELSKRTTSKRKASGKFDSRIVLLEVEDK